MKGAKTRFLTLSSQSLPGMRQGPTWSRSTSGPPADFVVVLQHDGHLLVDGRPTDLASMEFSRLAELERADRLQLQGPKGVTLLDEVLDVVKANGGTLNLDVKEDAVVDPAARLVTSKGMEASVIFTGCEQERAHGLRARFPHLQVLLNASDRDYEISRRDHSRFVRAFCSTRDIIRMFRSQRSFQPLYAGARRLRHDALSSGLGVDR